MDPLSIRVATLGAVHAALIKTLRPHDGDYWIAIICTGDDEYRFSCNMLDEGHSANTDTTPAHVMFGRIGEHNVIVILKQTELLTTYLWKDFPQLHLTLILGAASSVLPVAARTGKRKSLVASGNSLHFGGLVQVGFYDETVDSASKITDSNGQRPVMVFPREYPPEALAGNYMPNVDNVQVLDHILRLFKLRLFIQIPDLRFIGLDDEDVYVETTCLPHSIPCIAIRGISEQNHTRQNSAWKPYTAAKAAAYTKQLLLQLSPSALRGWKSKLGQLDTRDHMTGQEILFWLHVSKWNDTVANKGGQYARLFKNQIHQAICNGHNRKEFLPLDALRSILDQDNVLKILTEMRLPSGSQLRNLDVNDICGPEMMGTGRRKLLAILLCVERAEDINKFIEAGITDSHLPLKIIYQDNFHSYASFHIQHAQDTDKIAPFFLTWNADEIRAFVTAQSWMITPYFRTGRHNLTCQSYSSSYILPFIREGRYDSMMKIRIHPAHHDLSRPGENPFFALKTLRSQSSVADAVKLVKKYSHQRHECLSSPVLVIAQEYNIYLVFLWADTCLRECLAMTPPPLNNNISYWIAKQCLGISQALERLHVAHLGATQDEIKMTSHPTKDHPWLAHIRPEAILWFSRSSRLVLYNSPPKTDGRGDRPHHSAYEPPEFHRERKPHQANIWALGCVFLELISWVILGNRVAVEDFASYRAHDYLTDSEKILIPSSVDHWFFHLFSDRAGKVYAFKNSFIEWIKKLRNAEQCSGFVEDFLNLITKHMLVIDPMERSDIGVIVRELALVCHKAESLDAYLTDSRNNLVYSLNDGTVITDSGDAASGALFTDSGNGTDMTSVTNYTSRELKLADIQEVADVQEQSPGTEDIGVLEMPDTGLFDEITSYSPSETPSLQPLRNPNYINELAVQLREIIMKEKPDQDMLRHISRHLSDLLRAFSLKIGHRAESKQCHIAYFIHKYRSHVQRSLDDLLLPQEPAVDEARIAVPAEVRNEITARYVEDLILAPDHWLEDTFDWSEPPERLAYERPEPPADELETWDAENEFEDETTPPAPDMYRDLVLESPAFEWLTATLVTEARLTRRTAHVLQSVRSAVLSALPSSHEVSRKKPSREYTACFDMEWDPLSFVRDQHYEESPDQALRLSLTLTGSPQDAQVLTTQQYLTQTWPTTGAQILELAIQALHNTHDSVKGTLPDGTELQVKIDGAKFTVAVTGIGDSIAEVAQQFAWLGAALRPSPFESGIALCSPIVKATSIERPSTNPVGQVSSTGSYAAASFDITFDIQEPISSLSEMPGHCWHYMFRNPVMVQGYPIMAKEPKDSGVEMQLNVMSRMAGAKCIDDFDGRSFFKGFSTMLITTEVLGSIVLWHYCFNPAGERLSYLDHDLQSRVAVDPQQLGTARHVVGWCRQCDSYTGAENFPYEALQSVYLPAPDITCLLKKVSITSGRVESGGAPFALGSQHIPFYLTGNSYLAKLKWVDKKFVVMWDEVEKRGWLVNGTNALLHLVRASIHDLSNGIFSGLMVFNPRNLQYPPSQGHGFAAKVLSNPDNLKVKIHHDKSEVVEEWQEEDNDGTRTTSKRVTKHKQTCKLFEHVVEEQLRHLEQIMDHQVRAGGPDGTRIKAQTRRHLEGWDFMEVATGDDLFPRKAILEQMGWGWVDLIRSIEAITLFGTGFGDLIRPTGANIMCPTWQTLPTMGYYLAITDSDLERIIRTPRFGGKKGQSVEVVRDLLWLCPSGSMELCPCCPQLGLSQNQAADVLHHDPVQVLYPLIAGRPRMIDGPGELSGTGAVVFGHNKAWGMRWRERGDEYIEYGKLTPTILVMKEMKAPPMSAQNSVSSDAGLTPSAQQDSQSELSSTTATAITPLTSTSTTIAPISSTPKIEPELREVVKSIVEMPLPKKEEQELEHKQKDKRWYRNLEWRKKRKGTKI